VYCVKQALFSYEGIRFPAQTPRGLTRPLNIGGTCAFDAKKGFGRRRTRLVSCFQQASKKKFGFWDFWFWVCAHLIEKFPLAAGALFLEKLPNVAKLSKKLQNLYKMLQSFLKNCKRVGKSAL